MARQFTVITVDSNGNKIANPHVDDIAFIGGNRVALHNVRGDDYVINLDHTEIFRVNDGVFNLEGATYAYHTGLPVEEISEPGGFLAESESHTHDVFKE